MDTNGETGFGSARSSFLLFVSIRVHSWIQKAVHPKSEIRNPKSRGTPFGRGARFDLAARLFRELDPPKEREDHARHTGDRRGGRRSHVGFRRADALRPAPGKRANACRPARNAS